MHLRWFITGRMAGIFLIGITEILIAIWTIFLIFLPSNLEQNGAYIYFRLLAILTSFVSFVLGFGLIALKKRAKNFLIAFSILIILNKVLLFLRVSGLSSFVEFGIADQIRHSFSFCYHIFVIAFLSLPSVRKCFTDARG
jgi:hypothetical protein